MNVQSAAQATRTAAKTAARTTAVQTVRLADRTWLAALFLAAGLYLIRDDRILMWKILSLPAAVGSLGLGYWVLRISLFRTVALDSPTGAAVLAALLVAIAIVIGGIVGV